MTIRRTATSKDHIPGLPSLDDIAVTGGQDTEALKAFYEQYGFKGLVKQLETHDVPPELIEEHRSKKKVGPGPAGGLFEEPDLSGLSQASQPALRHDLHLGAVRRLAGAAGGRGAGGASTPRPVRSTRCGPRSSACRSASKPGEAAYIPLGHSYGDAPEQLPRDEVLARLKPWLENPDKKKLGQHIKYDRHVFANHGIEVQGYAHDTMLQSYVLEVHKPHGLASLAERHLGRTGIDYEDHHRQGRAPDPVLRRCRSTRRPSIPARTPTRRWTCTWRCGRKLQADSKLSFIYDLEISSSEALYRVERNGVLIDGPMLARQSNELGQRMMQLEKEAHDLAGQPFNLGSPKQIGEILFTKLGLPVTKKTPSGVPSTDEEVLEKLAEDYPLPAKLLEHRGLSKLKGTYTDKLAQMAHPSTRPRAHALRAGGGGDRAPVEQRPQPAEHPGQDGRRPARARGLHRAAGPQDRQRRLQPDRAAHHGAPERATTRCCGPSREGMDVHRATAAEVFGVAPDQVTSEQRRYAKVINFGLIYGMSAFGLARNLGIDGDGGQELHPALFRALSGREELHGRDAAVGQEQGLCRDGVRPAPVPAGDQFTQWPAPRRRRARRRSTRRCRARRPT